MANLAQQLGIVTAVKGTAFARNAEGLLRRVAVGDGVYEGEVITTGNGSNVVVSLFSGAPDLLVAERQTVLIDQQVAGAVPDASAGTVTPEASSEAARAVQGTDAPTAQDSNAPLDEDATAAGGEAGEAGSSFVNLMRIVEAVPGVPVVAYEFPINPAGSGPVISSQVLPQTVALAVETANVLTDDDESATVNVQLVPDVDDQGQFTQLVREESATGNVLDNTVNPDGPAAASVLNFSWAGLTGIAAGEWVYLPDVGALSIAADGHFVFQNGYPQGDGAVVHVAAEPGIPAPGIPPASYTVTDGEAFDSSTLTLVVPDFPVEGSRASYVLPEGDSAQYAVPTGTGLDIPISAVAGLYTGSLGTVVEVDEQENFTYTAPIRNHADQVADEEVFHFTLSDSNGSTDISTVTITIDDTGPAASVAGSDILIGGTGADTFVFRLSDNPGGTIDVVRDFAKGSDVLQFEDVLSVSISYNEATNNTTIQAHYQDGAVQTVLVEAVDLSSQGPTLNAGAGNIIKITG